MRNRYYNAQDKAFKFYESSVQVGIVAGVVLITSLILLLLVGEGVQTAPSGNEIVDLIVAFRKQMRLLCLWTYVVSSTFVFTSAMGYMVTPDEVHIRFAVQRRLWCAAYGNPLHLVTGQALPQVRVVVDGCDYVITVYATSVSIDTIVSAASEISSCLDKKYKNYAVIEINEDIARNAVCFRVADVTADKSIYATSPHDLQSAYDTKLVVQADTEIDLTTSGSMLFAGKTRSGKTTGVISVLLQLLQQGRDAYHSQVLIVDPKNAELSRLNGVVSPSEDGDATEIIERLQEFERTIKQRQAVLNDMSKEKGDSVKWWEAGMHASVVFLDEFVALRSLFPKKAPKDNLDYCIEQFDKILTRIVTMGASAGCYVIISIAEASVDSGGLPAMLRDAMSTRVLFRPTLREARFLWESAMLEDMPQRTYNPGDAWFSSTDGVHDSVSYVHFPVMDFPIYRELGRLLEEYYSDRA